MIESKHNQHVKFWRALAQQNRPEEQSLLWVEGIHLCQEALTSLWHIDSWVVAPNALANIEVQRILSKRPSVKYFSVSQSVFDHISLLNNPFGIAAIVTVPPLGNDLAHINSMADVLCFVGIQDPGNIGTLLRSAVACGIDQIITTSSGVSLWHPKVVRAAMGAHFKLCLTSEVSEATLLDYMSNHKQLMPKNIYALVAHAGLSIYQQNLSGSTLWLLGTEGQGLPESIHAHSQGLTIPHRGQMESLNVAVAGSVALFEQQRQREGP